MTQVSSNLTKILNSNSTLGM